MVINEGSNIKISLPMLIQLIGFIAAFAWSWAHFDERITLLEAETKHLEQEVNRLRDIKQ
jgi:Tfp pilus assembly protein PilN